MTDANVVPGLWDVVATFGPLPVRQALYQLKYGIVCAKGPDGAKGAARRELRLDGEPPMSVHARPTVRRTLDGPEVMLDFVLVADDTE